MNEGRFQGKAGKPGKPGKPGKAAGQRQGAREDRRAQDAKAARAPRGPAARVAGSALRERPAPPSGRGWREAIEASVRGLGYELVDIERAQRGLLRVTIDRIAGHAYAQPGDAVTVDDCEQVTRQLQYALEVEGLDYARLEVSSPGLDRPLKTESDCARFAGQEARVTLKLPFEGRKVWQGRLEPVPEGGWQLVFTAGKTEQAFGFRFDEVREARLVPVVDFKGRRNAGNGAGVAEAHTAPPPVPASEDGADEQAQTKGE